MAAIGDVITPGNAKAFTVKDPQIGRPQRARPPVPKAAERRGYCFAHQP
jgi:hypothetical protein